jgi:hypothetical protein
MFTRGESDGLVASAASHSGPVYSLDFNPFQSHLMCSGGAGAEVGESPPFVGWLCGGRTHWFARSLFGI